MRILADAHVSLRTVEHARGLGHDVLHVGDLLGTSATDAEIVEAAFADDRAILTQDLDFSQLVALSGRSTPSVISLRLRSGRVERVNAALERALPVLVADVEAGAIITVEDERIRVRSLPLS